MTAGSPLDSSVTLEDVFTIVGAKKVPLAPELAGYLVLEIAEHADPAGGDVDPRSVFISEEGIVALVKPRREGARGDAESSVRAILARLLETSGSQTPALAAASRRKGGYGLGPLAEELETALIPVNRAAGRRALARLAREVKRVALGVGRNALPSSSDAAPSSRRASAPSHPAVPQPPTPSPPAATPAPEEEPTSTPTPTPTPPARPPALALAMTPTPPPPGFLTTPPPLPTQVAAPAPARPPPTPTPPPAKVVLPPATHASVDSLIEQFGVSEAGEHKHARELKAMAGLEPTPPPPTEMTSAREDAPAEAPLESLLVSGAEPLQPRPGSVTGGPPASGADPKPNRGPGVALLALAVAIAAGAYASWRLRPAAPIGGAPERTAPVAVAPSAQPAAECVAALIVSDVPAHAEVLLRKGQAPVDIPDIPVGTRLEFVATAEGYVPARIVVPSGAIWSAGADGGPHLAVATHLEKSTAKPDMSDPWPPGEPGSEVGGQGPPGTMRITATPPGAEVWMLAGIGPEVTVDRLPCEQDFDVLVAGPSAFRKRLHVAVSDVVAQGPPGASPGKPTTRVARLSTR